MPESNQRTVILGATLIDGTGRPPMKDSLVTVNGTRIEDIRQGPCDIPAESNVINARDAFLIPGLMDANVHLVVDYTALNLIRNHDKLAQLAVEAAQVALRVGVTTVFDTWGPRNALIEAREAINRGDVVGSRIFLAGNIVGLGGPFSEDFISQGRNVLPSAFCNRINELWEDGVGEDLVWCSPEQVRSSIRKHVKNGIDFLKYAVTTHRGRMEHIMFSPRVQSIIVEEARGAGLTVQSHCTTNEGFDLALRAGVDLMQHVDLTFGPMPLPPETIDLMGNLQIPGGLLPQTESALAWYVSQCDRMPSLKRYSTMDVNARALIAAEVPLLLTTDGGVFSRSTLEDSWWGDWAPPVECLLKLGEGHLHWLRAVEQKGMSAMDALLSATRNVARAYRVDQDLGTIEVGKIADLVLLSENPLEAASNYSSVHAVMKAGEIVHTSELPTPRILA